MGILADIYISNDQDALAYDDKPEQFTERAQYKSISPLELSILWSIMRYEEWDVDWLDEFPCLLQQDDGERLIHRLPTALVTQLASFTTEQISFVTPKWAATEELGWEPAEMRPVVEDLVRLARRAAESGQSVYLWNCV